MRILIERFLLLKSPLIRIRLSTKACWNKELQLLRPIFLLLVYSSACTCTYVQWLICSKLLRVLIFSCNNGTSRTTLISFYCKFLYFVFALLKCFQFNLLHGIDCVLISFQCNTLKAKRKRVRKRKKKMKMENTTLSF